MINWTSPENHCGMVESIGLRSGRLIEHLGSQINQLSAREAALLWARIVVGGKDMNSALNLNIIGNNKQI